RTTITESDGQQIDLLSVPDLVNAKKTQRMKDWPMISALVEGHYDQYTSEPNPLRIEFWLRESRVEDRLIDLVVRFPAEAAAMAASTRQAPEIKAPQSMRTRRFLASIERSLESGMPLKRNDALFTTEPSQCSGSSSAAACNFPLTNSSIVRRNSSLSR
ncbi:MAG: hypothetical protein ACKOLA_03565, partial [Spartobacteria bacterium]